MAQVVIEGFVLSKQAVTQNGKTHIVVWLSTPQGPVKAISEPQQPVFFVRASQRQIAEQILAAQSLSVRTASVGLSHFNQEEAIAFYLQNLADYHLAKTLLSDNVDLYEDDIKLVDRFLMERFVKGGAWVQGDRLQRSSFVELTNCKFKANPDYTPTLTRLSLDIECSIDGVLYCIGLKSDNEAVVIMVGEQPVALTEENQLTIIWVADEIALLQTLDELIAKIDPDVIVGWNVIEFDFRVLWERAQALGIRLYLGRNREPMYYAEGQVARVLLPGRVVLDGIDMLKNATYFFERFTLNHVSKVVLNDEKLVDADDRLAEINRLFEEDKLQLAYYNLQDCDLVLRIFEKLHLLEFAIKRTQLTGLDLERKGGSVAAFINLYLPLLHRQGYIAPNLGEHGLSFESPGGYVMDSKPGLYKNVIVLDYKSLYPSIIRSFLIDPLGLVAGLDDPSAVEGFNRARFSRRHSILPNVVAQLGKARELAKLQKDSALSQAIKIIMNSLYGVLGSKGCRFYDPRLSSSITLRGHEIMLQTKAWIEELGYEVIYGDTDSTFVKLSEQLNERESHDIGHRLAAEINSFWQHKLQVEHALHSYLELEFEVHYVDFFMPTIRDQQIGSKKRYVGTIFNQGEKELIFKGMESVRSDWTELAQRFQRELFVSLFETSQLTEVFSRYIKMLMEGQCDELLVYKKRMKKPLESYQKNIPPHIKALKAAIVDGEISVPKPGFLVEYIQTLDGPKLKSTSKTIDYNYYIERQLKPIYDMVADFDSVSSSLATQQTRFEF